MINRLAQFVVCLVGIQAFLILPIELLIHGIWWVFTGKQWEKPLFIRIFNLLKYFNEAKF